MKKVKNLKEFFEQKINYTVSEELNKLQGRNLAPKKLEAANEALRNLKTPLPK